MKKVYKEAREEYSNLNGPGGCYANKIIEELEGIGPYDLAEELSHIGAFRKSLPKGNGVQPLSDESLQEMIDSGKDFFDIPELPLRLSNNKSEIAKERSFNSR